jgi:hypothetical protein
MFDDMIRYLFFFLFTRPFSESELSRLLTSFPESSSTQGPSISPSPLRHLCLFKHTGEMRKRALPIHQHPYRCVARLVQTLLARTCYSYIHGKGVMMVFRAFLLDLFTYTVRLWFSIAFLKNFHSRVETNRRNGKWIYAHGMHMGIIEGKARQGTGFL